MNENLINVLMQSIADKQEIIESQKETIKQLQECIELYKTTAQHQTHRKIGFKI